MLAYIAMMALFVVIERGFSIHLHYVLIDFRRFFCELELDEKKKGTQSTIFAFSLGTPQDSNPSSHALVVFEVNH